MLINTAPMRLEKLKAEAAASSARAQAAQHQATDRQRQQAMRAAMVLCNAWGDSPQATQQMRQDVQDTPAPLLPDLLQALSKAHHPTTTENTPAKEPTP